MITLDAFMQKLDDLINYRWELYFFEIINPDNYISHKTVIKESVLKNSFINYFVATQKNYIEKSIKSIQEFQGDNSNDVITEISADNVLIKNKLDNLKLSIDNSDSFNIKHFPKNKVGYVLVGIAANRNKIYIMKKSNPINKFKKATHFIINNDSEI